MPDLGSSKHHPAGGAVHHCDNEQIGFLMLRHQQFGDRESMAAILELSRPRALTLIRFHKTTRFKSEDELLSDIDFKLMRAVAKFDPQKGTAFTFVSRVVMNVLYTSVSNARKASRRCSELDAGLLGTLPARDGELSGRAASEDIMHRIKSGVKSILTDPAELSAQRWYIESFTDEGFAAKRHQCANAAMAVYQLSHARSRELYDLTMLEVRRVLYAEVKGRQQIIAGRLIGTRGAWMVRYRLLLTAAEFTKFVTLMRDLAPYLLLIVDPENRNRRRDRNPVISRRNVELILNGYPDAPLLFNGSISKDKDPIIGD
jgi:hypothetical protein